MQKQGEIIAKLISQAGYTQREAANLSGVRDNYLSRALKKEPVPKTLLQKLSMALGVEMDDLLNPNTIMPYRAGNRVTDQPRIEYPPADKEEADLRARVKFLEDENARKDRVIDALTSLTKK